MNARPLFFALVLAGPCLAAINPRAVILNIRQSQAQQQTLNAVASDGRRDRTIKSVRILDVECRVMGDGYAERASLRWFFIGKNALDGRFDYYSHGSREVTVPRRDLLKLRIVSEPLRQDKYVEQEFFASVKVTAGSVTPHGWVLWLVQDGETIKAEASDPGMLEWMKRNPPPRAPEKKKRSRGFRVDGIGRGVLNEMRDLRLMH